MIIGPEATSTSRQGMPEESKQPNDDLDRIKTPAIRYRAKRNADRGRATAFEEELAHTSAENLKLREAIRKLQTRDLNLQPTVEDPVEGKRPERPRLPQTLELPLHTVRDTPAVSVTTQPLGSILEAKPLHQGQKTRILGRGSQSCSHLYSTLPVPSQLAASVDHPIPRIGALEAAIPENPLRVKVVTNIHHGGIRCFSS